MAYFAPESPAGLPRNRWPLSIGISGRFGPEYAPSGRFNVIVPAIPEICTFGETLEEAREMAKDAIHSYLETAIKYGGPIPEDAELTNSLS